MPLLAEMGWSTVTGKKLSISSTKKLTLMAMGKFPNMKSKKLYEKFSKLIWEIQSLENMFLTIIIYYLFIKFYSSIILSKLFNKILHKISLTIFRVTIKKNCIKLFSFSFFWCTFHNTCTVTTHTQKLESI